MNYCECGCGTIIKDEKRFVSGHNKSNYKMGKKHYLCPICNSSFYNWESQKQKTCSISCRLKYSSIKQKGRKAWNKGLTKETNKSIKIGGEKRSGINHPMKKEQRRKKHSNAMKGKSNPNWRNGVSFEEYPIEFNKELKEQIRKRDNYKCHYCHRNQSTLFMKNKNGKIVRCRLLIHHIDYNKRNNNPENLISLCRSCHIKTNFNREYWTKYFKSIYCNIYDVL